MPDITQPETVKTVQRRFEGRPQGGAHGSSSEQPAKRVVANYEEVAKSKLADDRITILGIPVDQITPATQAALGGLVAEINFLRGIVKRHERPASRKPAAPGGAILDPETLLAVLGGTLAAPPAPGSAWVMVLVHVATYEDIRRSSGLLAANGALADVAQRLQEFRMDRSPDPATGTVVEMASAMASPFAVMGIAGGSNLAALIPLPAEHDASALARSVRAHLTATGYLVSGIEMALSIKAAATPIGSGESATLALGRADHLLRTA